MNSKSELAEATLNKRQGTGIDLDHTLDCNPDYWPGKNLMGKILKQVQSELLESHCLQLVERVKEKEKDLDDRKCKEVSPLLKAAKCFGLAK